MGASERHVNRDADDGDDHSRSRAPAGRPRHRARGELAVRLPEPTSAFSARRVRGMLTVGDARMRRLLGLDASSEGGDRLALRHHVRPARGSLRFQ
jgi:hypothetical protein